ncbi:hypothetical protein HYH02_009310 [Chlamydomonas schloesseri]|uniref:CEP76 C2 domain-containing protein n=1 Tax=Chlamydomonas schloesseri TaxID=2026947 RepID=A0A835TGC0_9CHLO|nr:hypothetical protein HYH02_009310 [Chlamydomonas schloesseri]|eukprot:KAG2443237.1 hypothetical protein HYH02_009310 [Chlamydomonas schloesseri]
MEDPKIAELRRGVRQQLQQAGVQNVLHSLLLEYQKTGEMVTPEDALDVLQGRGVIDQLVRSVRPPQPALESLAHISNVGLMKPAELPPGRAFLHVKVLGGRAFADFLARAPARGEQLQLALELFGQRLTCEPVPAAAEPAFAGEAFFELPAGGSAAAAWGAAGAGTSAGAGAGVGGGGGLGGGTMGTASAWSAADTAAGLGPGSLGQAVGAGGGGGGGGAGGAAGGVDPLSLLALRQGLHVVVMQVSPLAAEEEQEQEDDWAPGPGPRSAAAAASAIVAAARLAARLSVRRQVCALGAAEWRTALVRRGKVVVSVQLGAGPGVLGGLPVSAAPAGLLTLQLELRPGFSAPLDEALLRSQQRMEAARDGDVMTAFVAHAKAWWGEYVSQNLAFKSRPIKVLATAEDGSQHPVCSFVRPLQLGRRLASAAEAARLVSLLRRREDLAPLPTAGQSEVATECWCLLHTVLASGSATKEEMAVLLCGLLLGFGLDAWVVVGRLADGAGHTWVLSRGPLAAPLFWEPATGVRYASTDVDTWPYGSVGCVFNNLRLYANSQCDDSAFGTSYVFEDAGLWRELPMPPHELPALPWSAIPLAASPLQGAVLLTTPTTTTAAATVQSQPSQASQARASGSNAAAAAAGVGVSREVAVAVDVAAVEAALEAALRRAAAAHRRAMLGLGPGSAQPLRWDEGLGHLLMPALSAYEHEAVHCEVAPGNDEFQSAIRRCVPLGWVFKAMPQHHTHTCVPLMAKAMLEEDQMLDILGTTAPTAAFAMRVKVFAYPEGLTSVWLMLAVKYSAVAPPQ